MILKKYSNSRLAARIRWMYLFVSIVTVGILMIVVAFISSGIANDTSERIARQYSIEAAGNFQAHMNPHLTLMLQVARSTTIARWLADENNAIAKDLAFDELIGYASYMPTSRFMLTVYRTRNIYDFLPGSADWLTREDFISSSLLPNGEEAQWFSNTRDGELRFNLNIQREMEIQSLDPHTLQMWFNQSIYYQGRFLGVVSIGFPFDYIFQPTFGSFIKGEMRGYIIDEYGGVRVDSARILDVFDDGLPTFPPIPESLDNPNLAEHINRHLLQQVDGIYQLGSYTFEAIHLERGNYSHASISPITGTNWSVVVLSYQTGIFDFRYLPLIYVVVVVIILSLVVGSIIIRRIVIAPLLNLIENMSNIDISKINSDDINSVMIHNTERPDEIGDLSRAFQNMLQEIKEATDKEHESITLQRQIYNASPLASSLWSADVEWLDDGNVGATNLTPLDCNEAMVKMLEMSGKEDFLERFIEFNPEIQPGGISLGEHLANIQKEAFGTGVCYYRYNFITSKGELVPGECVAVHIKLKGGGDGIAVYFQDMREIYALMEKEKEMRERTKLMLDTTPLAVAYWNEDYQVLDCNQTALDFYGFVNKDDYKNNLNKVLVPFQPDGTSSIEYWSMYLAEVFEAGFSKFEFMIKNAKDEIVFQEVEAIRIKQNGEPVVLTYSKDITLLMKMREEQWRAEIAEESSRAKSRFLARMSHEIRTPISAVLSISEIQLQTPNLPTQIGEAFAMINSSADLLLSVINDILDLSKIEASKMELLLDEYAVASVVTDVVHLHLINIESRNIKFRVFVDENLPTMLIGDAVRIKQIMNNILSNAFKYTEVGSIELHVSLKKHELDESSLTLIISIRDTGLGMTEEQIVSLNSYNEYIRFHERKNRSIEGTGLGMSIAYNLAHLMNANIDINSEVGKGTYVVISIPQQIASSEILGKELSNQLQQFKGDTQSIRRKFKHEAELMPYGRVLVVDDVKSNLYVAEGLMKFYDLNIDTCDNGYEAIEKIKLGNVYDIIFMDHMMPGIDGIETMKILRDMDCTYPIVVLTANALVGQEEEYIQSGFDSFLSKPIMMDKLDAVLIKYVKDKQPPEVIEATVRDSYKNKTMELFEKLVPLLKTRNVSSLNFLDELSVMPEMALLVKQIEDFEFGLALETIHTLKKVLDV